MICDYVAQLNRKMGSREDGIKIKEKNRQELTTREKVSSHERKFDK